MKISEMHVAIRASRGAPEVARLARDPVLHPAHQGVHGEHPASLVEAAYVDGAGRLRAFVSIVVPVSRNALVTAALFAFLFAWSDFLFALTLMTDGSVTPITLSMYEFIGAHTQSWSALMATAVLASVPAAVLLVLAQRYIAAGVTGGAVK
jgi:multiple sugar transport system permease protein